MTLVDEDLQTVVEERVDELGQTLVGGRVGTARVGGDARAELQVTTGRDTGGSVGSWRSTHFKSVHGGLECPLSQVSTSVKNLLRSRF